MGLDVYFCKYMGDRVETRKLEQEYQKKFSLMWEAECRKEGCEHGKLSLDGQEAVQKKGHALKEELGLDQYGTAPCEKIEIDSARHPKHLFKIGYFRSSYNGGGFNSILHTQLGKDLYWVFDRNGKFSDDDDAYEFQPDWEKVLGRAKELLAEFRGHLEMNGSFKVMAANVMSLVYVKMEGRPKDENEALKLFREQKDRPEDEDETGMIFVPWGMALRVRAFIPGVSRGQTKMYVICEDGDGFKALTMPLLGVGHGMGEAATSEESALKVFHQERDKQAEARAKMTEDQADFIGGSYSNRNGDFFFEKEPVKVRALIPGTQFDTPALYAVYEGDFSWYLNAIEVVIEAFEHVLALPADERKQVYIHWSA